MKKISLLFVCLLWGLVVFGQKNKPIKILLISDLNDSYGSVTYSAEVKDVISKIDSIRPDLILCGGDMVAGQKASLTQKNLEDMWIGFNHTVLEPILKLKIPFGFTMGNHDASPGFLLDRKVATDFWEQKKSKLNLDFVDDSHFPYYYSYTKNNIFFISWDASSAHIPDEVKFWMKDQLNAKVAQKARGRVVLGHLPLYAIVAAKNKKGEVIDDADQSLAFFKENGVDMYISGHQHAYFPGIKSEVKLLNAGALGGGPRMILGHEAPAQKAYAILTLEKNKTLKDLKIEGLKPLSHSMIPRSTLPLKVEGFNGTIQRL